MTAATDVPPAVTTAWLLAGVGLPVVAWLVHIAALPALVPWACETGTTWPLHLVTLVLAGVAAIGVVAAMRTRAARRGGVDDAYLDDRARGWGTWGALVAWGLFLLILAEHVPVLVLSSCSP